MHSMLAFEFAGGWSDFKGSIAVTVLQFLLGGGGSFSSGGPGASPPCPGTYTTRIETPQASQYRHVQDAVACDHSPEHQHDAAEKLRQTMQVWEIELQGHDQCSRMILGWCWSSEARDLYSRSVAGGCRCMYGGGTTVFYLPLLTAPEAGLRVRRSQAAVLRLWCVIQFCSRAARLNDCVP